MFLFLTVAPARESPLHTCFSRFFLEETMRKLELKLDALLKEPWRKKGAPVKTCPGQDLFILPDQCD